MKRLGDKAIVLFIRLFSYQPFFLLRRWRDLLFIILYYILKYRKNVVLDNLKNSFPEKKSKELEQIARKFYYHLSNLIIEAFAYFRLSSDNLLKRIKFYNTELLEELYQKNKNVVLVMGHYGMWEWMLVMPKIMHHTGVVIYKQVNNSSLNDFMKKKRTKHGGFALSMKETLRGLIKINSKHKPWLAAFVADQTPTANEINFWTKFLNQDTPFFLGPEKIAKSFDAAVVYAEMIPRKKNRYDVRFELISYDAVSEPEKKITERFVEMLEKTIKREPQYWLWSHKRWKHKHLKNKK